MSASVAPHDGDLAQLRLFLVANLAAVGTATAGLVALRYTVVPTNWILFDAAAVAAVVVALAVALRLLGAGRIEAVLSLLAVANWAVSIATVTVTPFILPAIVLAILLPVVVTLPYLDRRRFLHTAGGAIATCVVAAVLAEAHLVDRPERLAPAWLEHGIVIGAVPVVMALVVLNLWRGHSGLAAHADQLQQSRARMAVAADETRRAIERDLHDGAQQRLSSVAIRIGLLRGLVAPPAPQVAHTLDALEADLAEAIEELRDLAHGIYPPLLGQRGLAEALRAAGRRMPVPVTVTADGVGRYPAEVETAVYFSCLEAMHNATKHGRPSALTVVVTPGPHLRFAVADDGAGFDPAAPRGMGLTNVADRLGSLGGEVVVASSPGSGTTITGTVPAVPR